jgi:lipopolysaccharide export system protein LptA
MQNNKPIEIDGDCQFMQDLNNNATMARYNVIVVKGQLQLFSKGIKPNRHFRLKDIKRYFGITGNTDTLINKINAIDKVIQDTINLSGKGGGNDE